MQKRKSLVENDKVAFSSNDPLVLHWDGKLLPDISTGKQKVDRVAIIVTGAETEKLLAVPEIARGTGEEPANKCLRTLNDCNLRTLVK